MEFKEWADTITTSTDFEFYTSTFGGEEVSDDWELVLEYSPGVIVKLKDGTYYCHAIKDEIVSEDLFEVERFLWHHYAKHEVDIL